MEYQSNNAHHTIHVKHHPQIVRESFLAIVSYKDSQLRAITICSRNHVKIDIQYNNKVRLLPTTSLANQINY